MFHVVASVFNMQCLKPVKIGLSDDMREKRMNNKNLPLVERLRSYMYVPCGKCPACLTSRRSEWTFRLKQEMKVCESCHFITLTYDDDKLNYERIEDDVGNVIDIVPMVCKKDVQLFLKRLRERIKPFKIRYFLVSEYGPQTLRPHYHMILFNFPNILNNKLYDYINESWSMGFISISDVNDARIHYVTGYCLDGSQVPENRVKNFMLCSRRPGLGSYFLDVRGVVDYCRANSTDLWSFASSTGVNKVRIPRYYRDKLFDDELHDKIQLSNLQYYDKKSLDFISEHKKWLVSNGLEVNDKNMKTPYPTSPLDLENQKKRIFCENVRKRFKNKKNG